MNQSQLSVLINATDVPPQTLKRKRRGECKLGLIAQLSRNTLDYVTAADSPARRDPYRRRSQACRLGTYH
jgi:hypothetical protein